MLRTMKRTMRATRKTACRTVHMAGTTNATNMRDARDARDAGEKTAMGASPVASSSAASLVTSAAAMSVATATSMRTQIVPPGYQTEVVDGAIAKNRTMVAAVPAGLHPRAPQRILASLLAAILVTSSFLYLVSVRMEVVRINYQMEDEIQATRKLAAEADRLEAELTLVKNAGSGFLQEKAKDLGLAPVSEGHIVRPVGSSVGAASSVGGTP